MRSRAFSDPTFETISSKADVTRDSMKANQTRKANEILRCSPVHVVPSPRRPLDASGPAETLVFEDTFNLASVWPDLDGAGCAAETGKSSVPFRSTFTAED